MSQHPYKKRGYARKRFPFHAPTPDAFYTKHAHYTKEANPEDVCNQKYAVDKKLEELVLGLPTNALRNTDWKDQYTHLHNLYNEVCAAGRSNRNMWNEKCSVIIPNYLRVFPSKAQRMITNSIFSAACKAFFTYIKYSLFRSLDLSPNMIVFKQTFQKHLELKEWKRHVITAYNKAHPGSPYKHVVKHVVHVHESKPHVVHVYDPNANRG